MRSTCDTCRFITARNISQADVLDLHAEILSVFDADDIITPDRLRGNSSSLKEALLSNGGRWALLPLLLHCSNDSGIHCPELSS